MSHWLREALYFVLAARRGRGRRYPPELWSEQYRAGRWAYLDSASELAHYMVIVGYAQHFHSAPSILDVGCGHGRLFQLLSRHAYTDYLGIDIAPEAVDRAQRLASSPQARFVVADFEGYVPVARYDVIIFNESLYYAPNPAELMQRYARALTPGGVLIVSMGYNWWQAPIWSALARRFPVLHSTDITNEHKQRWLVKVLRDERGAGAS